MVNKPIKPIVCMSTEIAGAPYERLAAEVDLRVGLEHITSAEGLLCIPGDPINANLIARSQRLRVISTVSVGYDHIDMAAAADRNITVTHTPGVLTAATAEFTFALILAAARRLRESEDLLRAGGFKRWHPNMLLGLELSGAILGIIGTGRIGRAVIERALAFGMNVLAHSRTVCRELCALGVTFVSLEELLSASDVVSVHVPLSDATFHMLGAEQLALMQTSALLVNTSRGPVIDEAALVQALKLGRPGSAALDVFEHEPRLTPGLTDLPNALLAPHIGSATTKTRTRMGELAVDNLLAVLRGKPPLFAL